MCHSNLGLLEALLSTIFRPKNIYCIYVDGKSPKEFKKAVKQLAAIYQYHFPQVISIFPTILNNEIKKRLSDFLFRQESLFHQTQSEFTGVMYQFWRLDCNVCKPF